MKKEWDLPVVDLDILAQSEELRMFEHEVMREYHRLLHAYGTACVYITAEKKVVVSVLPPDREVKLLRSDQLKQHFMGAAKHISGRDIGKS